MKLRNKLIPLMSVVAATTCVAPIATSCGANSSEAGMVDITKNYVPTIDKAAKITSKTSDVDAQDLYFQHLAENPEILAQDIYKYQADYLPTRINWIEHYDMDLGYSDLNEDQTCITKDVVAKVGISNISFKKVTYTDKTSLEEKSFYALSCDMKYRFAFKALSIDGEYEYDADLNMNASLHDIPTVLYAQPKFNPNASADQQKTNAWRISNVFTNSTYLDAIPGWNYTFDRKDGVTITTVDEYGQKHSETTEYNRNGVISRKEQVENIISEYRTNGVGEALYDEFLEFDSYHLSDVAAETDIGLDLPLNSDGAFEMTINKNYDRLHDVYGPIWNSKDLELFKITDSSLASKFTNYDLASVFLGKEYEYLPAGATESEFFPGFEADEHSSQYGDEENYKISFNYKGTDYTDYPTLYTRPEFARWNSEEFYDFKIEKNSIVSSNEAYWKMFMDPIKFNKMGWSGDAEDYENISSFTGTEKFTHFTAIPAGTYIGYAYANEDDESTFVTKTMEVTEDIPLVITIKA